MTQSKIECARQRVIDTLRSYGVSRLEEYRPRHSPMHDTKTTAEFDLNGVAPGSATVTFDGDDVCRVKIQWQIIGVASYVRQF